jgi:SAM-dependent methyltransferase
MGWYHDRILPRVVDAACGSRGLRPWRNRVCADLTGRVVEIGFGSGHNVAPLPDSVDELVAVEPSTVAWRLSQRRRDACGAVVTLAGLDGQHLDLETGSFDAALCTFTLCTVPDPVGALAELRRVLRPQGRLHMLEHGCSPEPRVARWQRRLDPIEQRLAGGCHLTRDPVALVDEAGFTTDWVEQAYGPGPKPWMWLTVGVFHR